MSRFRLLDTSIWIQAVRRDGNDEIKERVNGLMTRGIAAWCEPVRLELWRGVSSDYDRQLLLAMDQELMKLAVDGTTWTIGCRLADIGRTRGLQFPTSDLLIFGCAKQHDVQLISRDVHFQQLEELWSQLPANHKT